MNLSPIQLKGYLQQQYEQSRTFLNRREVRLSLLMAIILAVFWWIMSAGYFHLTDVERPWADQSTTFHQVRDHIHNPYAQLAWPYVPWATLPLLPFSYLPLAISVLLQLMLYFVLLTVLIFKFGGDYRTVLLVLTSAFAFDAALEPNMEWIVVIGLLVPPALSGPFLVIKPQVAIGYPASFRISQILRAAVFGLIVVGISLILWPDWINLALADIRTNTLGSWGAGINLAPSNLLPVYVSWAIGVAGGLYAFWKKDAVAGIIAGLFIVPYATFYSFLPAFAVVCTRWFKASLVASIALWIVIMVILSNFLAGF